MYQLTLPRKKKISNLTSSVYNINNNDSETEKSGTKTTYEANNAYWQVIEWSHKPREARNSIHI